MLTTMSGVGMYKSLIKIPGLFILFFPMYCHAEAGDLYFAVFSNNYERVKEILIYGEEDVNDTGASGATALAEAVRQGNVQIVCALMKYKADVNIAERPEDLPLFRALDGDERILDMLLEKSADVNIKNNRGDTPLHLSVEYFMGGEELTQKLLSAGADIEARNNKGRTPLMEAVDEQNMGQVVILVEAGAKIMVKDRDGNKLLDLAKKRKKIYEYLKQQRKK